MGDLLDLLDMENQKVIRTFVAVCLDMELRNGISAIQDRVKQLAPAVKWVAPENFHVTLKFLGGIDADRVACAQSALDEVASKFAAFDMSISGLGVFPNSRRPRVVWVGIEDGREQLTALAGAVETRLAEAGFSKEDKPFKSHITIGRVSEIRPVGDLAERMASVNADNIGSQRVDSIVVMKSVLRPDGPVYTALSVHKLSNI